MLHKRKKSLRLAIPALFALFVVPVSLLLAVYSMGLSRQVNEQLAKNTSSILHVIGNELLKDMEKAENFLTDASISNTEFQDLGSEADMTRAYYMEEQVRKVFSPLIATNRNISCILVYSSKTENYHDVYGTLSGDTGSERVYQITRIREEITDVIKEERAAYSEWFVFQVDDHNYLCRMIRWQPVYYACLIDLDQMAENLQQQYSLSGQLLFTKEGKSLVHSPYEEAADYRWTGIPDRYQVIRGRQSFQIVEDSIGVISLACLTPYQGLLHYINVIQILMVLLGVVLILGIPLGYRYLKKYLIKPMDDLMEVMERLSAGDMEARAKETYNGMEFETLGITFNNMISSVQSLQTEVYEASLENQRAQLTSLKLQIRPHFYLNCLKSVYALAALGRNKEVQEKVLYLSRHLRYVFTELGDDVSLREELDLCKNYVKMFGVGRDRSPIYREDIEPELADFRIPPVSLLTLVENALQYAAESHPIEDIEIFISAHILSSEEGSLVNIMVRDNGPGFPEDRLGYINNLGPEHVGLNNLERRLYYYYGEDSKIAFSNNGGAQADLFIPAERR